MLTMYTSFLRESRGKALAVVFFLALSPVDSQALEAYPEKQISFAAAWQIVDRDNDAIKASRAALEQAEHKAEGTKALGLPAVTLSANYLYLDDAVELSPQDLFDSMEGGSYAAQLAANLGASYGLNPAQMNTAFTSTIAEREHFTSGITASWPVFTGGRIRAAQAIAAEQAEEGRQAVELERLKQFESLSRYYFGAVLAEQVLQTRREVEAGLKEHRDHAVLLENQGQIARVERMQSEASFDKAVVERKKAERDLEIARVAVMRTLRVKEVLTPSDQLFIADDPPSLQTCLDLTLASYPGLHQLNTRRKQAEGLADVEKGKYFPTVALVGNYNLYEQDELATKLMPDWLLGVGVSMPLLERSGRHGNLQAARTAVSRIDHMYRQAESDLSILVEKTHRELMQALEEYEGLRSSKSLAEETVRLRIQAFSQGLGTSLDVVDAELFLASVKTQRAVAAHQAVTGLARLLALGGRPEEFFSYQNTNGIEGK